MSNRKERVRSLARDLGVKSASELLRVVETATEALAADGDLDLGPREAAGGVVLEFFVRQELRNAGFEVKSGPPGRHDGLVVPPPDSILKSPVVLEVKSSKYPTPSRDDLRQLDDWVFELSGEERIRRYGTLSLNEFGPSLTPHKGLLVFNGPRGVPFAQRARDWLGEDQATFARQHHLCVARFDHLLAWCRRVQRDDARPREALWKTIHATGGALAAADDEP